MRTTLERMMEVRNIGDLERLSSRNGSRLCYESNPLFLEGGRRGFKIRAEGEAPSIRLDFNTHGRKPANHIQYGQELFTGRSGNEAVDIFANLFIANPNISLPAPKMPSMPKYRGQ